jgi:hypothetical protein
MNFVRFTLFALALVAASLSSRLARADEEHEHEHFDVLITRDTLTNSLVTGGFRDAAVFDENNVLIHPANSVKHFVRVFGTEIINDGSNWVSEDPGEPGFRATDTQSILDSDPDYPNGRFAPSPSPHPLKFDFLPMTIGGNTRSLFYWDGSDSVEFGIAPGDTTLTLNKAMTNASVTDLTNIVVPGFTIANNESAGFVHQHLYSFLNRTGNDPAEGFYLVSLGLNLEGSGLQNPDPIFVVFAAFDPLNHPNLNEFLEGFEVAHAEAQEWVEATMVPEPTGVILAGIGGLTGLMIWRRRRIAAV